MASNNQDNSMTNSTILKFEYSLGADEHELGNDDEIKNEKALVEASAAGDLEKISKLLSSCVLVDSVKYNKLLYYGLKNYMTPLQLAAANGHEECLDILINHGADVNAKDPFDVTALHMAAEKGYFSCVKKLLDAGANARSPTKYSKTEYYKAVPYLRGTTPLHLAAANDHADCCKILIDFGADYNAIDEKGRTSLFIAAQCGFSACVLTQLRHEVCYNILSLPDLTKNTPLHFAVHLEMLDCVSELLKLGSDVNHINETGFSPLHIALMTLDNGMSRSDIFFEMLIRDGYNTDVNLPDSGRYAPLHYVCYNNYIFRRRRRPQLAKLLIIYGADININYSDFTLLQWELTSPETDYDILIYMVRSMLYLPRLEDLIQSDIRNLDPDLGNVYSPVQLAVSHFVQSTPFQRIQRLHDDNAHGRRTFPNHERYLPNSGIELNCDPHVMEKLVWYEQMASSTRTLKHCCRFAIRKAMGYRRLKHVGKLPIPPNLQSYILLQVN